jgi:hypothetical protein
MRQANAPPPPAALQTSPAGQSEVTAHTWAPPPMHMGPIWHVPPPFVQQIIPASQLAAVHGGAAQIIGPPPPAPWHVSPAAHSAVVAQT